MIEQKMQKFKDERPSSYQILLISQFMEKLQNHLSLHSKIWRNLRTDIAQGKELDSSLKLAREEVATILLRYIKQYANSRNAILHEIIELTMIQRPNVNFI